QVGEEAGIVLDARQGELYFARYRRAADGVEVVRAPCVIQPGELGALAPTGLRLFGDSGDEVADAARVHERFAPSASALLELGRVRHAGEGSHPAAQLEPLYLRAFASRSRAKDNSA